MDERAAEQIAVVARGRGTRFTPAPGAAPLVKVGLLAVALLVVACGKTNRLPPEAWGVADYARAGLHIDRPWAARDYEAAQRILVKVTAGHPERLPRFHGEKSGAVLAKLLTELPDDSAKPVHERVAEHFARFRALKGIAKLYVSNPLGPPPREWTELMGETMLEAVVLESNADALLASFGPDDPQRKDRLEGLDQMNVGFGVMVLGALYVADDGRLPEDNRVAELGYVTSALPVLFRRATPETQHKIRDVIAKMVAAYPPGRLADAAAAAQRALPK